VQKKPVDSNIHESTNDSNQVESTIKDNNKIYPMDARSYFHPKSLFIHACQLKSFRPRIDVMIPLPKHHLFHPSRYPTEVLHSSLLTPIKGPQIFISAIVVEYFCISNLSIITSNAKMKGVISKDEAKRLAKEQQEMEKGREEQGKAPKNFQSKPKNPESELDFEVEGEKKKRQNVSDFERKRQGNLYQNG